MLAMYNAIIKMVTAQVGDYIEKEVNDKARQTLITNVTEILTSDKKSQQDQDQEAGTGVLTSLLQNAGEMAEGAIRLFLIKSVTGSGPNAEIAEAFIEAAFKTSFNSFYPLTTGISNRVATFMGPQGAIPANVKQKEFAKLFIKSNQQLGLDILKAISELHNEIENLINREKLEAKKTKPTNGLIGMRQSIRGQFKKLLESIESYQIPFLLTKGFDGKIDFGDEIGLKGLQKVREQHAEVLDQLKKLKKYFEKKSEETETSKPLIFSQSEEISGPVQEQEPKPKSHYPPNG